MLVIEAVPLSITERPGQRELQIFRSKCRFRISRYNSWNTWVSTFSNLYNSMLGSKTKNTTSGNTFRNTGFQILASTHWWRDQLILKLYAVVASRGTWGHFPPQLEALPPPPLAPNQKKKMVKISHFWQIFWIFAPSETHFAPSMPPQKKKKKKKNSGAATD